MKCPQCGTEMKEGEKKCPECGAKRPGYFNFIKRRQLREQETAEILEKSYIRQEDVAESGVSALRVVYRGTVKEELTRVSIKLAISVLLMGACIAVIAIRQYTELMADLDTVGTAIVLLGAFLLLFGNGAAAANAGYYLARLNALKKQGMAASKINYGKNPTAVYAGNVYEVSVTDACPKCEQPTAMHIEQVQDMLVAVCNADRNHLFKLEKAAVFNAVMEYENKRSGLAYTPIELPAQGQTEQNAEQAPQEGEAEEGQSPAGADAQSGGKTGAEQSGEDAGKESGAEEDGNA